MNTKTKIPLKLILLLVLPAATGEALQSVYNAYVPIYLQAGGAGFDPKKAALTLGFGLGAALVGFWLTADNILAFLIQPLIGAWSDRTRSKLGRRLPFVLGTLPLIVVGYALIPLAPRLIPSEQNGQFAGLGGIFLFFTGACVLYYLGYMPVRAILQTLRQEVVDPDQRSKVESWYYLLYNVLTILAYTVGGKLYQIYPPLLFWTALALYAVSAVVLLLVYREPADLSAAAASQEESITRQLSGVFRNAPPATARNLTIFLISAACLSLTMSAMLNFGSSWAVNVLGKSETEAASVLSVVTISATLIALPAGYIAGKRFGRRNLYLVSNAVVLAGVALLAAVPGLFIPALVIFGLGMGGALTVQLPLASEIAYKQESLGAVIGVYNFAYMLGFLLGANIVGLLIERFSYAVLPVSGVVFTALALLFAIFIKTRPGIQEIKG